jgi:hypothetical protein
MPMSNIRNTPVEVLTSVQRRRRWTPQQKLEIIFAYSGNTWTLIPETLGHHSGQHLNTIL